MSSRTEHFRKSFMKGASPLGHHSLDSKIMQRDLTGERKFYREAGDNLLPRKVRRRLGNLQLLPPLPHMFEVRLFPNSAIEIVEIQSSAEKKVG